MGHVFQVEFLEKHHSRHHLFIMAKEIGKEKRHLLALFMKIKEIRRKGRWKVIGLHEEEIEQKIEEIEENRGLNDKKASKDRS